MNRANGTIVVQSSDKDLNPELIMEVEQMLNTEIAQLLFQRFRVGLRVHLNFSVKSL